MTISCNIWMICLDLNGLFNDPSWMLQLSEFVCSSVWVFLTIFSLQTQKIEARLVAIAIDNFST